MKKLIALAGVLGVIVLLSAGLRGCYDFMKPTPWAPEAGQRH